MAALTTLSWLLLASSVAFATNFLNCTSSGDGKNPVDSVYITNCDNSVPLCDLFTGQTYQLNLTFRPGHQLWATDTFLGVKLVPITGGPPLYLSKQLDETCGIISTGLPIDTGVPTVFKCSTSISGNYLGNYMSELTLNDETGNVFCTQVEIVIF